MTSPSWLLILLFLIIPQSLFSQGTYFNNSIAFNTNRNSDLQFKVPSSNVHISLIHNNLFSGGFVDTLNVKSFVGHSMQNQTVRPHWIKGAFLPIALIMAGTITLLPESHCLLSKYTIQEKVLEMAPGIQTSVDNYLQFVPLVAVFGLKAAGVRSRSDFVNQVAITAKAELLMGVIVHGIKKTISSDRPDDGKNSMPSGHTAQAFVAATILDMEYRDTSPWISVGGYAVATTTAIGRMVNNKHWISDVLIGAGIGIFSAKVVYYTHQYRWGKNNNIVILPAIYKNGGGISFAMVL